MARGPRPLPGWTKVSAARYRNPEGEEVSRRQYDNARLRALGFRSRAERERVSSDPQLRHFAQLIAQREGRSERSVARDPAYAKVAGEAYRTRMGRRGGDEPGGAAARVLTMAGLRDADAENKVGEGYERRRRARRRR